MRILILLILIPALSFAQTQQQVGAKNTTVFVPGFFRVDSGASLVPNKDTNAVKAMFPREPLLGRFARQSGNIYVHDGAKFVSVGGGAASWGNVTGKPSTFPPLPPILTRILNSPAPDTYTAIRDRGFNEIDIIPSDDGTGDYELVWDDRGAIRYIRFHNPEDLQGLLGTAAEKVIWEGIAFPSIMKVNGRYYVYAVDDAAVYLKQGATIEEVITATPEFMYTGFDPTVRPNPHGGYIAAGHTLPKAWILTAPFPEGPWTPQGLIFVDLEGQDNDPGYGTNQADGSLFFKDGQLWYLIQCFHATFPGQQPQSHNVIVPINDRYKAAARPVEFIDQSVLKMDGSHGAFNPVYIENQGRTEIWYSASTGTFESPGPGWIARMVIGDDATPVSINPNNILSVKGSSNRNVDSRVPLYTFGTVTNTVAGGITASGTTSGIWSYTNTSRVYSIDGSIRFKATALPSAGQQAVLLNMHRDHSTPVGDPVVDVYLDSDGFVHVGFYRNSGVNSVYRVDNPVSPGEISTVSFRLVYNHTTGFSDVYINGVLKETINFGLVSCAVYSLFNDYADGREGVQGYTLPAGRQFRGTIYSADITMPVEYRYLENTSASQAGDLHLTGTLQATKSTAELVAFPSGVDFLTYDGVEGISRSTQHGITMQLPSGSASQFRLIDKQGNIILRALGSGYTTLSQNAGLVLVGRSAEYDKPGGGIYNAKLQLSGGAMVDDLAIYPNTGETITSGASTPVPATGAGTIRFQGGHFYGWDGSIWKQLDN